MCLYLIECWQLEAVQRPSFREIMQWLEDIASSSFAETSNESFHTMQDDWKQEIQALFDDLRQKEQVFYLLFIMQLQ